MKTGEVSRLISRPSVYAFVPSAVRRLRVHSQSPSREFKRGQPSFPFFSLPFFLFFYFFTLRRMQSRRSVAFDEGCKYRSRTSKFKEPEPETVFLDFYRIRRVLTSDSRKSNLLVVCAKAWDQRINIITGLKARRLRKFKKIALAKCLICDTRKL